MFNLSRLSRCLAAAIVAGTLPAFAAGGEHASPASVEFPGDGDCAPALNAAIASLGARGGRLNLAAGTCWLRSSVTIRSAVEIVGQGWHEGPGIAAGTWFKITEPGFVPFVVAGEGARGTLFRDVAVWQKQPDLAGPAWAPTDYPFVFDMAGVAGTVGFSHVLLAGVTRGLRSVGSGRLEVDGLVGQAFDTGVEIDDAQDVPHLRHLHFWPYVTADRRVMTYQSSRSDAVLSERDDNPVFEDVFALGMRSALHFTRSRFGRTSKFTASDIDADLCGAAILIEADGVDGSATNLIHQGDSVGGGSLRGSAAVLVRANDTVLRIANLDDRLSDGGAIVVRGAGNTVEVANATLQDWGRGGGGEPGFDLAGADRPGDENALLVANLVVSGPSNALPAPRPGLHVSATPPYIRHARRPPRDRSVPGPVSPPSR